MVEMRILSIIYKKSIIINNNSTPFFVSFTIPSFPSFYFFYSKLMQQQQSHAQYYDKLLHHLNRTFLMNMKAQQLFLDLTKQTKTIRFKSIKNIYNTLTQGKADEVIYQKDKQQLINNHVFNQKFTQRTCWRIIQKMVNKVAYYLSNQHLLGSIAPSIVKVIAFLRTANEKVNNRASFVMFFQQVLDCIIKENNILEQKVYDLLIKRGYIYSIDQFYRLNRFQGSPDDYVCPNDGSSTEIKEEEEDSLEVAGKSIDTTSIAMSKRSKSKSRFGGFSSKKFAFHNRSRTNLEEENIPEVSEVNASGSDSESESGNEQEQPKAEDFNRLSHQIHQQMEKTVDQLLNNHNFDSYITSSRSQDHVSSSHDALSSFKPSVVKLVLKNLKNRNFKANQKILVINHSDPDRGKQQQRKNSSQTLLKRKNRKEALTLQRNRTSIAVALNKGMRERIFKNQHLADIQDLIINNLDRLQNGEHVKDKRPTYLNKNHLNPINKKNLFKRSNTRQHTQNLQVNKEEIDVTTRRASNFQFLNNAFNFQGKAVPKNSYNEVRRISNFGPECRMSEISSNLTIQTTSFQDRQDLIDRYISSQSSKKPRGNKKSHLSNNSQCMSRFAQHRQDHPKQNRFHCQTKLKSEEFNPTILTITAQKYNKCITQQNEPISGMELKELDFLTSIKELSYGHLKTSSTLASGAQQRFEEYKHHRRYETFDRRLRRML